MVTRQEELTRRVTEEAKKILPIPTTNTKIKQKQKFRDIRL